MTTRMQQRRGTSTQWTNANPVLAAGEIGFETNTNRFKIGDGVKTWDLLEYFLNVDALDLDTEGFVRDDKVGAAGGVASLNSSGVVPPTQMPETYLNEKINGYLAEIVGAAPAALNTLNEISAAFNNDPNFADTVAAGLDLKAPKANPVFTGTVTVPSVEAGDSSAKAASTNFVTLGLNLKAPINNPTFTGDVVVPTLLASDSSSKAAPTSYVMENIGILRSSINSDIADTNANVQALDTMVTVAVEGRLDTLETSATDAVNELSALDSRVGATESDIASLESSVTTLNNATDALESAVDALELEMGSSDVAVASRLDSAEADIDTLTTSTNTLDSRLDNHDTSIATLQSTAATLETAVDAVEERMNTAEADIIALETSATTSTGHTTATTNVHGIADTADLATKSYADNAKTDAISTSATAIALKADIASPALTGTPTAPTASVGTNTTQLATTAFVKAEVDAVIAAAPGALNTLDELAAALGDDANFATTVTTNLASKAPTANPTFTGTVALPAASSVTLGGTALSTTLATKADNNSVINTMSGAHTIVAADVNNIREMSGGGTISIPADNSFWPVGAVVDVIQTGSSQVTVAGGSGVTVNATPGLKIRAQWSSATILKRAANTFVVMGDLSA
jgi:predicted  nucleic acid-binding Zn-ribbon protein